LTDLSFKRQKSTFLPSVNAFYQYSDKTEKADFDISIKHVMGVSVSVPIFSSGMRMAQVSQAKMELDKMKNMKEQQSEFLNYAAQQALFDYNSAKEQYNNEKENFELSERVFKKTTIRFKEGVVSALDLSTINNQFLQAQMTYSAAIQELLSKKIALDKAFNKLN
jgi:outer membrane protein TolC